MAQPQPRVVRIGIYPNAPQVFVDEHGEPRGIYVDILNEVARLEGWTLEFVESSFAEGLTAVRDGKIDVMTSIAASPEREKHLDFSQETIVSVWAQLYVKPGFDPQNIFDLEGKKVAVMKGGILGEHFIKLCKDFEIHCQISPVASYDAALQAVQDNQVDGAVINSILGFAREHRYRAVRSSIVFSPFRLHVAVPKGENQDIVNALDSHLAAWRTDKNSFYFHTLDRWLGVKPEEATAIPVWVWWVLVSGAVLILTFFYWNTRLRREISARIETEAKLEARTNELHNNEQRLNLLLDLSKVAAKLTEKEILERSLDIAVEVTHSRVGYLHLVNDDQENLTLSTWNAETLKHCTAAHDDHYPISMAGIWADAVRFMKPVVHNDYQSEPNKRGYPVGHFHLVRHMSAPVLDGDRVSLIIGVGNKDTDYSPKDVIQLQTVANDIEKMVMRRRAEEALGVAKEEAESANTAKSKFLASMSHDLRTPLNAIMGFSDMMRTHAFGPLGDAHYEQYADDIFNSGTLLVSLINDVLDLSKIEAGKYELVEETLDLSEIIQMSFRQLEKMAESAEQVLSTDISPDKLSIRGDERAMIQVLNNLLSNAIKFTPAKGSIFVKACLDQTNAIIVSVTDTGIGMTEEGVKKALQPFEQADGTHSRRHEGTGLGLHLCTNFMKLFGGTLNIESSIKTGTTIELRFPPERTILHLA